MVNEEEMIIAGWLLGFHLEDLGKLNVSEFKQYGNVVKSLKRGERDPFNISKDAEMPIGEISRIISLYAESLYILAMKRMLKERVSELLRGIQPDEDIEEILNEVSIYQNYGTQVLPDSFSSFGTSYIEELDRRGKEEPVTTGFPKLDSMTCGFKRKELTTIAARPSTGKSAIALQLAVRFADRGNKVLFFPLEMSALQTIERIVFSKQDIDQRAIRTGKLKENDWNMVNEACQTLDAIENEGTFKIYEAVNQFEVIEDLVKTEKPFAIVVDQLEQLRSPQNFKDKRERFSFMTNNLKRLAIEQDVAVILLAQLRRDSSNAEPTLESLKESGSIEEDSDNVILLHRYKPDEMNNPSSWGDNKRPIKIDLAKQRTGPTGNFLAAFMADKLKFYQAQE